MAYAPPFVMLFTLGHFAKKILGNSLESKDRFPLLLLLAAFFSFLTAFPRADFMHVIFALWPSLALMAYWMQRGAISASKDRHELTRDVSVSRSPNSRFRSVAIILFSSFIFMLFLIHRTEKNLVLDRDLEKIAGKKGKGIYGEGKSVRELNEVIHFLRRYPRAGRSEPIFSTNPSLYFLTSRPNATSCDYVIDGNVGPNFENEIVRAVNDEKPCLIILDRELRNQELIHYWKTVEGSINQHYTAAFASSGGRYEILERNNEFSREIRKLEGLLSNENVEFRVIKEL